MVVAVGGECRRLLAVQQVGVEVVDQAGGVHLERGRGRVGHIQDQGGVADLEVVDPEPAAGVEAGDGGGEVLLSQHHRFPFDGDGG